VEIQRACEAASQLPITVSIITSHLDEFLQYSQALLLRDAAMAER